MSPNKAHSPMVPVGSGHVGEIFLKQTIRVRSRRGASRVLSAAAPIQQSHSELFHLACAVLRQACADAGHAKFCHLHNRRGFTRAVGNMYRRNDMWDALLFLTDPGDEWLSYWCDLAGYDAAKLREEFVPIREAFEASTGYRAA